MVCVPRGRYESVIGRISLKILNGRVSNKNFIGRFAIKIVTLICTCTSNIVKYVLDITLLLYACLNKGLTSGKVEFWNRYIYIYRYIYIFLFFYFFFRSIEFEKTDFSELHALVSYVFVIISSILSSDIGNGTVNT